MNELAVKIKAETEYQIPAPAPINEKRELDKSSPNGKIEQSIKIIKTALEPRRKACVAFSGGSDSLVLLDLMSKAGIRPVVIWGDTQMEYPESQPFIEKSVARYGLKLHIAKANRTPREQWQATGFPMLGKRAARLWMRKNRGKMGFSINVTECCRGIKICPSRILARNLGCNVQITGQRGQQDDSLRGMRHLKDGVISFQVKDKMWIANPLTGWTDIEIKSYIHENKLEEHPARRRGAATIGCVYCGGGSQYTNSGYRVLRKTWPQAWTRFMVEWKTGLIILALKYKTHLYHISDAVREIGGLKYLARHKPWVFDFTRMKPLAGYKK